MWLRLCRRIGTGSNLTTIGCDFLSMQVANQRLLRLRVTGIALIMHQSVALAVSRHVACVNEHIICLCVIMRCHVIIHNRIKMTCTEKFFQQHSNM